jgi:hypothetical protein
MNAAPASAHAASSATSPTASPTAPPAFSRAFHPSSLPSLLGTLACNEVRLRLRRLSTLVALFAVIVLSWQIIVDPNHGTAILAIKNARVLYTSSALAISSAMLASPLFALLGFYLVRGRIGEDLRSGVGSVIAATPVGNGRFLLARWLGGVAYLGALLLAMLCSIMLLHLVRGDGPLQPAVYLLSYCAVLLPMVFFGVGMAILFDSIPFMMGKLGDVAYFFIWVWQLSLLSKLEGLSGGMPGSWLLIDFSGMVSGVMTLQEHWHSNHLSIGSHNFDPKLTPITLPVMLWSAKLLWLRAASALLALLPLLPAAWLFHRYSPDKVKASHASTRRSPLQVLNQWLRPLARRVQPLFALAARLPGPVGQIVAEVALTLANSPASVLVLALSLIASLFTPSAALPGLLVPILAFWGVLISDISSRDHSANLEAMTSTVVGTAAGGMAGRFWHKLAATGVCGLLFMGLIVLRLALAQPFYAAALLSGIFVLSVLATVLGYLSRTARTFLSLFLFWVYVALNAHDIAVIDLVGFNHAINGLALGKHLLLGVLALAGGWGWLRWRGR